MQKNMLNKLLLSKHVSLMNYLHTSQLNNVFLELDSKVQRKIQDKNKDQAWKFDALSKA